MKCVLALAVVATLLVLTVNARPNYNDEEKFAKNVSIPEQTLVDFQKCAKCVLGSCLSCKPKCIDHFSLWSCAKCVGQNCIDCISACS